MANEIFSKRRKSFEKMLSDEGIKSNSMLPWDRFSNWLHCACVVTFDLELGQAMELMYPSHVKLTEREKMNICYLSFPDSNSGCMGDTEFHFRIRQCHTRKQNLGLKDYNHSCPVALQGDNGHYYGFVYFRQTKDKSIRRGYFQKSVVLISRLPFVNLFSHLINIVAPEYFDNGEPSLEAACHDIDQWPPPVPGQTLNLPIMGTVIQVRVPCRTDKIATSAPIKLHKWKTANLVNLKCLQMQEQTSAKPHIPANNLLPSIHEVDLYSTFQPVLPHIQMLWELVISGESIVVMASSPTVCCRAVQALVSMIWPLKFCTDYRPYFTIHDSEFKEYTTKTQAPPPVLLGVTNPFFAKTLQHWPHIVRIGELVEAKGLNKLKKAGNLKTLDSKPGVYTRYKAHLQKDKTILKRLAKPSPTESLLQGVQTQRPVEVQNAMLKRYLLELTQSFMIPLERYMASLMPLQRSVSPHKGPPKLKQFQIEEFLKTLESSGPQLTSGLKGDWEGLYRKFFKSAHFIGWYNNRQQEVNMKLQAIHAEAMCNSDLVEWIRDKQEVEVVDLILRLREKLNCAASSQMPVSPETVHKLQSHHDNIISQLPPDLRSVLKSA